jgi:hypothetical protein
MKEGPSGSANQEPIPSHRKLLRSRAVVVSGAADVHAKVQSCSSWSRDSALPPLAAVPGVAGISFLRSDLRLADAVARSNRQGWRQANTSVSLMAATTMASCRDRDGMGFTKRLQ